MFAASQKAARRTISASLKDDKLLAIPITSLPKKYSLAQISSHIDIDNNPSTQDDALEKLLLLSGCLEQTELLHNDANDKETAIKLSSWVAKAMLPDGTKFLSEGLPEAESRRATHIAQHKGMLSLSSLKSLLDISPQTPSTRLDPKVLLSIITFISSRDPWTTPTSQKLAETLLSRIEIQAQSKEFIIDHVIQSFIRPLFSKSKPETITSTGRKAMPSSAPPQRQDIVAQDSATKPWKIDYPYSITVLSWAVSNASKEIITSHWNIFIPPLLTLLDTPTTPILVSGLQTLTSFLSRFPTKLLQQTGLGEVFEDAVLPTVLYLPTITPLEESIMILPAAFEALFILADVRYPITEPGTELSTTKTVSLRTVNRTSSSQPNTPEQRIKYLDRLMRKGILTAYLHASEHHEITSTLITALSTLISKMGIDCVKHLKNIMPILTDVLLDPFAAAKLEGMESAIVCLRVLVLNTWPRMGLRDGGHGMEVVRCLVGAWKTVVEAGEEEKLSEERKKLLEVKGGVIVVGKLLVKSVEAVNDGVNFSQEVEPLLAVDASLGEIFGFEVEK